MARHGATSRSPPRKARSSKSRSSSTSSSRSRSSSPYFKHKRQKRSRSTSSFTSRSRTPRRARKRSPGRKRSYSPRRRASSPRRKSRSSSPRRRHKHRSRSRSRSTGTSTTASRRPPPRRSAPRNVPPRKRSPAAKRRSVTPKRRSPTPKRRSASPKRRSTSPKRRSVSTKARSPSTKQTSPSPKRIPTSPQHRSKSPASPKRGQHNESSSPEKPSRPSRPAKKAPPTQRETVSRTPSPQYLGPRGPIPYRRSRSQSPHRIRMMKRPPSSPPRKQGRRSLSPMAKRGRSRSPGLLHGMVPTDKIRPKSSGDYGHAHILPSMRPMDSEIVHSNIIKPRPRSGERMYERVMPRRRSFSPPLRAKIRSLSPAYERGPPRDYGRVPVTRGPMVDSFRVRGPDHGRERFEESSGQYFDVGMGSAVIFHQGSQFEGSLEKASLSDRFRSKEDKPFVPKENITIGIERNIKGNSPVVFHREFRPEDVVIVRRKEEGQKPLNMREEFQTDPDDEYTERRVVKVVKSDNEIDRYEEKFQRENFQVRSDRFESSHGASAAVSLSDRWRLDEDQERRLDARNARSKNSPEVGSSQDVRNGREAHSSRDTRSSRDARDTQDTRDNRTVRDSRGTQDSRGARDSRSEDSRNVRNRDQRDSRNVADSRTVKDNRTISDSRSVRDSRNIADSRTVRDSHEHDERRDTVPQDRREIKDSHFDAEPSRYREEDERLVTERRRDIVDSSRDVSDSRYISREGRDERIVTDRYTVTLTTGDIHAGDDRKERYERDPHDLRHNLARRRQGDEHFDARSKIRDNRGRGYERRGRGYHGYDRGRGGYGGYDRGRGGYDRGRGGYDRYNSTTSRFSSSTDKEDPPNFSKRVDKYKYEEWKDKPEMIPRGAGYFEHDNRDEEDYWQRNRGRGRFRGRSRGYYGYQSGRGRGYYRGRGRGRGYGYGYGGFSPEREWVHDKYSDDEADNKPSSTTEK